MDLENQKRVKDFADEYGAENLVVVLGAAEGEAAGLAAETVTAGDPTFAGPLTGVQLGLTVYHVIILLFGASFHLIMLLVPCHLYYLDSPYSIHHPNNIL